MFVNTLNTLKRIKPYSKIIFMLPFAGGNSYSYKEIIRFFPKEIIVVCPELPGRGELSETEPLVLMNEMVDYLYKNWISKIPFGCKYIIYGHSMGALLAYLLSKKLSADKKVLPSKLIVSGRQGPQFLNNREMLHPLPSKAFRQKVSEMGGIPEVVLENDALMDYFEPILKADFKAVETYRHTISPKLDIPISVFYGDAEDISTDGIDSWKLETCKQVDLIGMEGNHFFIFKYPKIISECLMKNLLGYAY